VIRLMNCSTVWFQWLIAVFFWRKVNVSKLLRKFEKLDVSAAVRVSEKDLERLLDILERNN